MTLIKIQRIDLTETQHQQALLDVLNQYAQDPMGGGTPLSAETCCQLVPALSQRCDYYGLLAFDNNTPVGLLNAFEGFSTFYARPLLNIHDLAVVSDYRGQGIAKQLLQQAQNYCEQRQFCKLTLEVLADNQVAQSVYKKFGFAPYQLSAAAGCAQFWEKKL